MKYGQHKPNGKISIKSAKVFCDVLANQNPLHISSFPDFLSDCEALVKTEFKPTQGALNNVRGNWYEWLISVGAIHFLNSGVAYNHILVPLPNVRSLDYMSLYSSDIYKFIDDLRTKTSHRNVSLISSNPDFAISKPLMTAKLPDASSVTPKTIDAIDEYYNKFLGQLDLDDLAAFASIKTSLRPDRRLQLSHEGALVKAFYEHLKGRLWKIDAKGVNYYGVSIEVKEADKEGLRTVATHSILSVNTIPEAAVDEVFQIANGSDLGDFLSKVLC